MKNELFKLKMKQGQDWIDLIVFEDLTSRLDTNLDEEKLPAVFAALKEASNALLEGVEQQFEDEKNATADR